jgi:hypothetical protein
LWCRFMVWVACTLLWSVSQCKYGILAAHVSLAIPGQLAVGTYKQYDHVLVPGFLGAWCKSGYLELIGLNRRLIPGFWSLGKSSLALPVRDTLAKRAHKARMDLWTSCCSKLAPSKQPQGP